MEKGKEPERPGSSYAARCILGLGWAAPGAAFCAPTTSGAYLVNMGPPNLRPSQPPLHRWVPGELLEWPGAVGRGRVVVRVCPRNRACNGAGVACAQAKACA